MVNGSRFKPYSDWDPSDMDKKTMKNTYLYIYIYIIFRIFLLVIGVLQHFDHPYGDFFGKNTMVCYRGWCGCTEARASFLSQKAWASRRTVPALGEFLWKNPALNCEVQKPWIFIFFDFRLDFYEGMAQFGKPLALLFEVAFWSAILQTTGCRWRLRVCAFCASPLHWSAGWNCSHQSLQPDKRTGRYWKILEPCLDCFLVLDVLDWLRR